VLLLRRAVHTQGLPVNPRSKRPHGLSETIATAVERMRAVVPSVLERTPLKNQFYVGVQHGLCVLPLPVLSRCWGDIYCDTHVVRAPAGHSWWRD
jgi:hypothetical protein